MSEDFVTYDCNDEILAQDGKSWLQVTLKTKEFGDLKSRLLPRKDPRLDAAIWNSLAEEVIDKYEHLKTRS